MARLYYGEEPVAPSILSIKGSLADTCEHHHGIRASPYPNCKDSEIPGYPTFIVFSHEMDHLACGFLRKGTDQNDLEVQKKPFGSSHWSSYGPVG